MTRVAILWHMHQPYYEDLVTREHILPWVRLHALKDYYGMVALLREFPDVRVTFNLVPSLLVQLEAFAAGRAHDRYLEVGMKPAADLTKADAAFMAQNFFHAQRQHMIDIYPAYADLLAQRGSAAMTVDDLRDLQVWQKLAWIDPSWLADDERVRPLVRKGSQFTEDDKHRLRTVELELLNAVIPEYRAAAGRGQIEISTSPFYHPILPLLCDAGIYTRTHPDSKPPRFVHPEDALEQLTRAAACCTRLFGTKPVGLWPSEGSVSPQMVPLAAQAGFEWMATDEQILGRTLGVAFGRDAGGHLEEPERLYTPYVVKAGGAEVRCLFRDHSLSDLIGFTYASWDAEAAADDFVGRLVEAGRRYSERTDGGEAVIPIILDGENAWEHFEGGGRPFLRALYKRLANHAHLKTVTMAEACRGGGPELSEIFPGSWIDANFSIWIGHADDQRAWRQLAEARDAIDSAGQAEPAALARAVEEILIAEGSDWFWWYGDDHSSDHDAEFDDLFRRHLRNVYRLLRKPVPDDLFLSNISAALLPASEATPTGLLTPTIDGEENSYFEWLGAARVEARIAPAGAMHQSEPRTTILTLVQFGYDLERLYIRLDGIRPARELLADGYQFSVIFLQPEGRRVVARLGPDRGLIVEPGDVGVTAAAGSIIEVAIPFASIGASPGGAAIEFLVAVADAGGNEVERHPTRQPVRIAVPDRSFDAINWTA